MPWSDFEQLEQKLMQVLNSFDRQKADETIFELIAKIYQEPEKLSDTASKRLLIALRRKSLFRHMTMLSEALLRSGHSHPQVRRQYAQSLIDRGIFTAAELVLQVIIQDPSAHENEQIEARGLMGRIYKQLYVNASKKGALQHNQVFLEQALSEYLNAYRLDPHNYWHGINAVALIKRAQMDGISFQGLPDADRLANEILSFLQAREKANTEAVPPWETATAFEAFIALGQFEAAEGKALDYSLASEADAFEISSTLRQLTEVWKLNDQEEPGSKILPILRAALLRRKGGAVSLELEAFDLELDNVTETQNDLEKIFGSDRTQTLEWYETGLRRAKSVARIETHNGKGIGTGWLASAKDFFPEQTGLLLVTNAHVVSNYQSQGLKPNQVRANFHQLKTVCDIGDIVWSSPKEELDTTFLSLKGEVPGMPLPIQSNAVEMCAPPPRLYIIGHPGGRNLELSIHDNHLIACNETFLHYRTPTENGSSGSPVFDQEGWKVVALHHRGKQDMPRIDGVAGTYQANEGISIAAIKNATKDFF